MKKNKNICMVFVLAGLLAIIEAWQVFAADSSVSYEGGAEKFIFLPGDGNLFSDFTGVMPGDSLHQNIAVRCEAKGGVNLYLRAEGIEETKKGFLEQMTLTVCRGETVFSEGTAGEPAGLTENILLGHFREKEEISLEVILNVPLEMDNRFQDAAGEITWVFTAEEMGSQEATNSSGNRGSSADGGRVSGNSGRREETGNENSAIPGGGQTAINEEAAPLAGILPDQIAEWLPENIRDVILPLSMLPQTGDAAHSGLWEWIFLLSGIGGIGGIVFRKLRLFIMEKRCR